MTLKSQSTYTNRRSYVLKLRSDAAPGAVVGRIENLVTGETSEFSSGPELLASIAADLLASLREAR